MEGEGNGKRETDLSAGFVVVEIHEVADVPLLLLDDAFGSVDELAGELDSVADVVTGDDDGKERKKKKKNHIDIDRKRNQPAKGRD